LIVERIDRHLRQVPWHQFIESRGKPTPLEPEPLRRQRRPGRTSLSFRPELHSKHAPSRPTKPDNSNAGAAAIPTQPPESLCREANQPSHTVKQPETNASSSATSPIPGTRRPLSPPVLPRHDAPETPHTNQ
jgi:hypothetical protein